MPISGPILALDLASRCGVAHGDVGGVPTSYTVALKKDREPRAIALGNFVHWMSWVFREYRPAMLVTEAPLPLQAFKNTRNSENVVRMAYGLAGIAEAMAHRFGVPHTEVSVNTVRKHFLGKANLGSREATKLAVVSRCHLLRYLPRDCRDNNRGDALATWDWACAHLAKAPNRELYMFDEAVA